MDESMSSSSSDENETTIHSSSNPGSSGIYSQLKAGSSKRPSVRHDVSDAEDDEEPYEGFRKDMNMEVDERITTLLSSLHFEHKRDVVTADEDDNKLRELHENIFSLITTEPDFHRRRRLKKALPASNCIREQVYYLRRKPITPPDSYYHRLNAALHTIVKESFGEEYRKVATVLGLVEALAEVLILEVHAFGIPETNAVEHRNIRKLIANALTNLTYGQILSKRRLCSYDGFIRCVVRIIIESPNITQVYAGLIRNLSWNADSGMSEALQPTVHALSLAAVYAHTHRFDVTAILSALWNLAGHSVENKRTICETPNCLKVLANILSPDARFTTLVDSASGILKYVSQYLATNSSHLELRSLLITRMLTLLKSSSFTCVTNTLGAIAHLIAKDPHMQQLIRQDAAAVQQLNVLRNSNREDIRKAVKEVLNTLNQPCSHRYGDMSHSVGGASGMLSEPQLQMQTSHHGYHGTASPRLLSLRATRASPGKYIHPSQQQHMQVPAPDQRSSSLPRHFAVQRNGFMMAQSFNQQMDPHQQQQQQQMIFQMQQQQMMFQIQTDDQQMRYLNQQQHQQQQQHYQQQIQRNQNVEPVLPVDDDLDIPTSTVMGTRSNSERSLGSMNPGSVMTTGGWNSTLDTAANSSRALSPVSFSDIPASPTMCAQVFNLPVHPEDNQMTTPPNHPSTQNTTHYSSGSANTMTRSDGTTVPIDNLITPTYATLNVTNNAARKTSEDLESPDDILPGPSLEVEEEGDYAIITGAEQKSDDDLLTRSIQEEMPTSSSTPKLKVSPRLNGFFSPSQKTTSSPAWSHPDTSPILKQTQRPKHHEMTTDSDRLLMESIMSEMPRSRVISPRLASGGQQYLDPEPDRFSHSKNEEADRRDAIIASHEPSDQGMNVGRGSSPQQQQLHRMESLESQASSEDSFGLNGYQEEHNTSSSAAHTMRIDKDDVVDASLPMDCVDDEDYDYTDDHFDDNYEEDYEDSNATQFDEGIDPQLTIDCSMISSGSGSSLQKAETTAGSRDSGALATSTPIGSVSSLPGVRRAKKVSINGKTRLPVPKTNGSLVDRVRKPVIEASRPRLPPKPSLLKGKQYHEEDLIENQTRDDTIYVNAPIVEAEQERIYMNALKHSQGSPSVNGTPPKSAIVSPYNYQKPPFPERSNGEINEKNVTPNPKQMLVTIV